MASAFLAREWINFAFRTIAERRQWSWLTKRGQFLVAAVINTGTVLVTRSSDMVTGTSTGWTGAELNRQFRTSTTEPVYTIIAVDTVGQTLTLDRVWGGSTASAQGYQIWNAYLTVPTDFHAFISVIDTQMNWRLWTDMLQTEIDAYDAQRANTGTPYVLSTVDYDTTVTPPLPRYELWPYRMSQYVYPFLYESRPPDLNDSGASLPRYIRGDVLLEMALAQAARWPGPSKDSPNPYFNLQLALQHEARAEKMIMELERQDDEVSEHDVKYSQFMQMPFAPLPWADSRFLQSHSIGTW